MHRRGFGGSRRRRIHHGNDRRDPQVSEPPSGRSCTRVHQTSGHKGHARHHWVRPGVRHKVHARVQVGDVGEKRLTFGRGRLAANQRLLPGPQRSNRASPSPHHGFRHGAADRAAIDPSEGDRHDLLHPRRKLTANIDDHDPAGAVCSASEGLSGSHRGVKQDVPDVSSK